jgi:hypothetical protein
MWEIVGRQFHVRSISLALQQREKLIPSSIARRGLVQFSPTLGDVGLSAENEFWNCSCNLLWVPLRAISRTHSGCVYPVRRRLEWVFHELNALFSKCDLKHIPVSTAEIIYWRKWFFIMNHEAMIASFKVLFLPVENRKSLSRCPATCRCRTLYQPSVWVC